jgi:hypothetical protein
MYVCRAVAWQWTSPLAPQFRRHVTLLFVGIHRLIAGISKCVLPTYEQLSFSDQTFLKFLHPSVHFFWKQ